jgi:protein-tyrosine kinase
MENIRQAVERARAGQGGEPKSQLRMGASAYGAGWRGQETELNSAGLLSRRIVSHNGADHRSRPYDMLRTQVLQSMDVKEQKVLGITSPTPACGKTLTTLNLALSIARQPERSVVLVDLDLQKPQLAGCLGLTAAEGGVLGILEGRSTLQSTIIPVRAGNQRILVLPSASTKESSEWMASRQMCALLQDIKREFQSHVIILDLPPLLTSDDVIAVLPQMDCILLVAAVGISKASEIEECNRHLQSTDVVRLVLNKARDARQSYYN